LDDEVLELMIFKKYKVQVIQVPPSLSSKAMDATFEEKLQQFENYNFISCSWFGFSLDKTNTNSSSKIRDDKLFENCFLVVGTMRPPTDVNSCA